MTRSIDPILVSLTPYTAVPSTLSLPIREPVSLASVTIVEPPSVGGRATGSAKNRSRKVIHASLTQTRQFRAVLAQFRHGTGTSVIAAIYLVEEVVRSGPRHEQRSFEGKDRQPGGVRDGSRVFGVLAMRIVDHGPWSKPRLQTAEIVDYPSTSAAAKAAGATVTPTAPKTQLEPIAPGPKPAQPAIPAPGASTP